MNTTIEQRKTLLSQNLKTIVTASGGAEAFCKLFKGKVTKPSLYAYIRSEVRPNVRLLMAVTEKFGISMDDLHNTNLKKSGWQYKAARLPIPQGEFIGGKDGYTYRVFQVIELLMQRNLISSLNAFVETLDDYRGKYTAFTNMRLGIQKAPADVIADLKKSYPEVNVNFIFDGQLPVFFEPERRSTFIPKKLEKEINSAVAEAVESKLKEFSRVGTRK